MNFIKKAKTQVKTIISKYEVSKDEEFDALLEKYKNSKKNSPKIVSHLKMLSDHAKGMNEALCLLSEDFAQEYDASDSMRTLIAQIHKLSQDFQKTATEELDSTLQNRAISHVKNFSTSLDGASKSIESREKAKFAFDEARNKVVQQLESKKPVDQQKFKSLQQDLATATATYNSAAFQCKKEIYELTHARAYNPAISSLCEAMFVFSQSMSHNFAQLQEISQQVNQIGAYQAKYPDNRETVRPAELNMNPTAGFATTYHPSTSSSSGVPPIHQSQQSYSAPPPSQNVPPPTTSIFVPSEFDTEWYYLDANVQQKGPIGFQELKTMFRNNTVTASTHVFGGTLTDWAPLGTVKGLMAQLTK